MSDVIENTFSSLSRLLNENLISSINGAPSTSTRIHAPSKGFENFIRAVSSAKTTREEDSIIHRELRLLKQRFSQPDVTTAQSKEYMVRVIYCCLLGYDVSFAGIHAVKLAQHGNLQEKRTGYLAASLLLHEDHELTLLLINTLQKDLSSSNILENCMALIAVCHLVGPEMAPTLLPVITDKLRHPREVVRKKAVMCIQKFHERSPMSVHHLSDLFRAALCDKDPGVMSAALHIYLKIFQESAAGHQHMVGGFVSTLTQVITRKLPADLEYHAIPSPWLQIRLLRALAALGRNHQGSSALMYGVVRETLQRATVKDNAAFAVIYECIITITTIWPNEELLHAAASNVGKFLRSKSNNLKYIGLKALGRLVGCGQEFARDYQMIVVECLDDPDPAIQRQTYDLLYQMTNPSNVEVICKRLLKYLAHTHNQFLRTDLISKITQIINNFAPNDQWYITSMNEVLEVSRDEAPPQCSKSLLNKIQKGCSSREADGQELRDFAVATYQNYLHRPTLSCSLLNVASWVVGEYADTVSSFNAEQACGDFVYHYEHVDSISCRNYVLSALRKLFINGVISAEELDNLTTKLETYSKGHNLGQRLLELKMFSQCAPTLLQALRVSSVTDPQMDFTLSFLDAYVTEALESGSDAYRPRSTRFAESKKNADVKSLFGHLQFDQQSSSLDSPGAGNSVDLSCHLTGEGSNDSPQSGSEGNDGRLSGLNMRGVRRVWGRGGVVTDAPDLSSSPGSAHSTDNRDLPLHKDTGTEEQRKREELAAALFSGTEPSTPQQLHGSPKNSDQLDKEAETLVIHKPVDGHDWRKFRKPINDTISPSTVSSLSGQMAELLVQTPPQGEMEHMACEDIVRNLPTQPNLSLPSSENYQTIENTLTDSRQPDTMYDQLKCELTEEEIIKQLN